ncbi:MAG: DUF418 domain-containing protein [Acidobacteriia bacterium]|nr:DUF418 domain-containing protein [Terriglobia bacterium]
MSDSILAPISGEERINSIDVLRGFALLGILLMNILTFGLPMAAYGNPNIWGGADGWDRIIYFIQFVAWDGKMRALFSLVFGAGVIVLTTRGERRGAGVAVADIYYRRMFWLLLFGLVHAYVFWWGDILYPYALCGLLLFPLRKLQPKAMLITAAVMMVLLTGMSIGQGYDLQSTKQDALKADLAQKQGLKLTTEQEDAQKKWKDFLKETSPTKEQLDKEVGHYRGSYLAAAKRRARTVLQWHGMPYYSPVMFDLYAMMLIGMALMKLDVLSAAKPMRFYVRLAGIGLGIGLPVNAVSTWMVMQSGYDPLFMPFATSSYQIGRATVALGYLAIVMIVCKAGVLGFLTRRLAAVGQSAFSNYISHSIICSLFFYGHGLGMFGKLHRYQLYFVVLGVWMFNLTVSPIWLRHFRFGPLEWCWRSLTYWKKQPMRIQAPETIFVPSPDQAGAVIGD